MAKVATKGARSPANKDQGASAPSTTSQGASTAVGQGDLSGLVTGDLGNTLQQVQDGDHLQLDGEGRQEQQGDDHTPVITLPFNALAITSVPARFCRAGRRFTHEETIIALADLSEEEMVLLRDEPMLRVRGTQVSLEDIDLAATLAEHHEERA